MNVCNYIPTKYLDDKGYNLRLRLLFKEVCFLKGAGGTGVLTIVAGTGISVNSTDPQNPIVTATGGAAPISSLTAAVASNSIDNVAHLQLWEWNSLTSGNGLQLNSSSTLRTGTGSQLLRVYVSGANAASGITSIAIAGSNVSSGTNSTAIGGLFSATGGATKNIGAQFSATGGTNNYALIVPSGGGNVGINTSTPAVALDVVGDAYFNFPSAVVFNKSGFDGVFISADVNVGDEAGLYSSLADQMIATHNPLNNKYYYGNGTLLVDGQDGYVGINNPTPSVALDVVGDATITNGLVNVNITGTELDEPVNLFFNSPFFPQAAKLSMDEANGIFSILTDPNVSLFLLSGGGFRLTSPVVFINNGVGGSVRIESLTGTGTRAVVADASGVLSAPLASFQSRVTSQFNKTNDTLANITGLTATLVAGKKYRFEANLYCSADAASGVKFAIAGTVTATAIIYGAIVENSNRGLTVIATSLGSAVGEQTFIQGTYALAKINGTITVNAAGTLVPQFAQNVTGGVASSVLIGSTFVVTEMV